MNLRRLLSLVFAFVLVASAATVPLATATASTAADGPARAELKIWQPHYIDAGVVREDAGNVTVYETKGRVIEIQPRNFNGSDVRDFRIAEDVDASIRYDRSRDVYVLDTKGVEGTLTVSWFARETTTANEIINNETKTVTKTREREYRAIIKTSTTDLAHVQSGTLEQYRQDAENWSEVSSLYGSVGNPSKSLEQKLQLGANAVDAIHNPTKALSGDFGMAIQAVFLSAGGLIFFALWNLPHLIRGRRLRRENNELKEQIGELENGIDDALDEIFTQKRKRYLKEKSWNDWFDDHTAAWLRRRFAPEPWSGFRRIMGMLSPAHLNGIVAAAMIDSKQYRAIVEYDPDSNYAADGGEPDVVDVDQDVLGARIVAVDELADQDVGENERVLETSDDLSDEIAARIDPTTLDSDILRRHDVDLRTVALPIGNTPTDDDFVEQLNVSIPQDFESREHFAQVLETIITKVAASDYATEDGEIDPSRDLANLLMGFASIGGESYNQPYLRYIRDLMLHNIDRLDASRRTVDVVEDARDRGEQGSGS